MSPDSIPSDNRIADVTIGFDMHSYPLLIIMFMHWEGDNTTTSFERQYETVNNRSANHRECYVNPSLASVSYKPVGIKGIKALNWT